MKLDIHNIKQSLKTNQEASVKLQKVNIFIFGANMLERHGNIQDVAQLAQTHHLWELVFATLVRVWGQNVIGEKYRLWNGGAVCFSLFQDLSKKIEEQRNAYISASSTVNQTLAKHETSVQALKQVNSNLCLQNYRQV